MNVEKSFTFPFEDKEWVSKLGLGALISMIPILNFAWSGYLVSILRNIMNHNPEPLPTWDDLDLKFRDGLMIFGAGIIYALPVLIGLFLPLSISLFSSLFSENNSVQNIGQAFSGAEGALFFSLICVLILYGIALSVLYPAILVIFAREGTFTSCFMLNEAFALIRKNAAAFFTAWGLSMAAGLGVGLLVGFVNLVVGWVPCLGWMVGLLLSLGSGIYSTVVYAHLFGQFGRIAEERKQLAQAA